MTTGDRNGVDHFRSEFIGYVLELRFRNTPQSVRRFDRIEKGCRDWQCWNSPILRFFQGILLHGFCLNENQNPQTRSVANGSAPPFRNEIGGFSERVRIVTKRAQCILGLIDKSRKSVPRDRQP
jgi:hypothetical protein